VYIPSLGLQSKKRLVKIYLFLFKIIFYIFFNRFDMLILKINFKK
jgi:hypothetical protein